MISDYASLKAEVTRWVDYEEADPADLIFLGEDKIRAGFGHAWLSTAVPTLSDVEPTNDLLTAYPLLYLYAALSEGVSFMKGEDLKPEVKFAALLDQAIRTEKNAAFADGVRAIPQ